MHESFSIHFLRYLDRHLIYMLNFQHFIPNPNRFCSSHVNDHSVVCLWEDNKNEKRHKRYSWVYYATKKKHRKIQKSKNDGSGFIVKKNEMLVCTRNRFHGNDAQWRNLSERPGVKAKGLVDLFSQTGGIWHSASCLLVIELLRLPFACYEFQLFAGYSFFIIILKKMYAIYEQAHPLTRIEYSCTVNCFRQLKTILLWWGHHSFLSTSFIPRTRWRRAPWIV